MDLDVSFIGYSYYTNDQLVLIKSDTHPDGMVYRQTVLAGGELSYDIFHGKMFTADRGHILDIYFGSPMGAGFPFDPSVKVHVFAKTSTPEIHYRQTVPPDVQAELDDPSYKSRTHGEKSTSASGCRGPLCRLAERLEKRNRRNSKSTRSNTTEEQLLTDIIKKHRTERGLSELPVYWQRPA